MATTTITVSTAAELKAALGSATGGETLLLKSGNYGDISLSGYNFGSKVTIASESGKGASFGRMTLSDSSNLDFERITFDYNASPGADASTQHVRVENGSNIAIRNSVFDGDVDSSGYGTGIGIFVTGSDNIVLRGNEHFDYLRGALIRTSDDVKFLDNEIHGIRSDGLNLSQVDGVLVENNHFHSFRMKPGSGDHPDMIQVHTGGTDVPTQNVTFRGNFMSSDDYRLHGIWMANELVSANPSRTDMYYRNILIEDNVIFAAHPHGISIGHANGLTIRNNTVLHSIEGTDDFWGPPQIAVTDVSRNVQVRDNIGENYKLSPDSAVAGTWDTGNNLTVQNESPSGATHYSKLFVNALVADPSLDDLRALPGSLVETMGVGSKLTLPDADVGPDPVPDPTPDPDPIPDPKPDPIPDPKPDPEPDPDPTPDPDPAPVNATAEISGTAVSAGTYFFDASLSADDAGFLDDEDAVFEWSFGNGATATGRTVLKSFDAPGSYEVTLTVTTDDETDSVTSTVEVADPVLLKLDGENATVDSSSYAVGIKTGAMATTAGPEGPALRLDDNDRVTFDRTGSAHLHDLDGFSVSFGIKLDGGAASAGRVFTLHESWFVDVEDDGELTLDFTNADGKSHSLTTSGAGLTDGDWHEVRIVYSDALGEARIRVDDALVGSAPMSGKTRPMEAWDPSLGYHWTDGIDGLLDDFTISTASPPLSLADLAPEQGGLTAPVFVGGDENDRILGSAMDDVVDAGDGDNMIRADLGADHVTTGAGADAIHGGDGDDVLSAGDGADVLRGGAGSDLLQGGYGKDVLAGGAEDDIFEFLSVGMAGQADGSDRIVDFTVGEDVIDLSSIDADITRSGDQAFTFVEVSDASERTGTPGELISFVNHAGRQVIAGNIDDDRSMEFRILLTEQASLTAADFVL